MEAEQRYEKFRHSLQPGVKLQIAAEDFFSPQTEISAKTAYGDYLRQRIRPAVELLIAQEDTEKLSVLWNLHWIPEQQLDDFLKMAQDRRSFGAFLWLLDRKTSTCGFSPRDFSL